MKNLHGMSSGTGSGRGRSAPVGTDSRSWLLLLGAVGGLTAPTPARAEGNSFQFQPGACSADQSPQGQCDAKGIPSVPGTFCELKNTSGKEGGEDRIYRFTIPSTGTRRKNPLIVTLKANPQTGVLGDATVSSVAAGGQELRQQSNRTTMGPSCTDPNAEPDAPCFEQVINQAQLEAMELSTPGQGESTEYREDFDSAELQDYVYERNLQRLVEQAGLQDCDFYANHVRATGGFGAQTEAGVAEFFNQCEDEDVARRSSRNELGCSAGVAQDDLGLPLEDHKEAITRANEELNYALIDELRGGLMKTLTALALSNPDESIPGKDAAKSWTSGGAARSCPASSNSRFEEEAEKAKQELASVSREERQALERAHQLQTALDLLDWQQRKCANSWMHIGLGLGDVRGDDARKFAQIEGENKVVEMMSEDEKSRGYEELKKVLFPDGKAGLFGLEARMFEPGMVNGVDNRYSCGNSVFRGKLVMLKDAVRKQDPKVASFIDGVTQSGGGSFAGWLGSIKAGQEAKIRQQLTQATELCAKAAEPIESGWFSDSGLTLWNNRTLVESVVRSRIAQGKDVSWMGVAYCQARKNFDAQTSRENKAILGMTGAAMLAAPVAGFFELGGTAAYAIWGLGVGTGLTSAGISYRNTGRTYDDLLARRMALSAGLATSKDVREAQSAYHEAVLFAVMDLGFAGVDAVGFSRSLGEALHAARPAGMTAEEIDGALRLMTEDVQAGRMSREELSSLASSCAKKSKGCTKAVEQRLLAEAEAAKKDGTALASVEGSAKPRPAAEAAAVEVPKLPNEVQTQLRTRHSQAYSMVPKEDHDLVDAIAAELYRKYAPDDYEKLMKGEWKLSETQARQVEKELEGITQACANPAAR